MTETIITHAGTHSSVLRMSTAVCKFKRFSNRYVQNHPKSGIKIPKQRKFLSKMSLYSNNNSKSKL